MNAITTTEFEMINSDTVKYSNPTDLVVKTQEEKIVLGKALDKAARLSLDMTMTARILDIASEAEAQHGQEFARNYLSGAKGIVSDAGGKIERRVNLLAQIVIVEVEDDEETAKLQEVIDSQKEELSKQYSEGIAKAAILANDLKRAKEVIEKLQEGEDVTNALQDNAKLREQLAEAQTVAGQVPALKNEADVSRETLANAKTLANGLKMDIQKQKEKTAEAERALVNKTGEALLDHNTKMNAKALAAIEVSKNVRIQYPLQDYLLQNGMTKDEIKLATNDTTHTEYDTHDVEAIASIIYSERNAVSDSVIVDKIEALVADALVTVAKADNSHTYETLKNQWTMVCKAMVDDALGE